MSEGSKWVLCGTVRTIYLFLLAAMIVSLAPRGWGQADSFSVPADAPPSQSAVSLINAYFRPYPALVGEAALPATGSWGIVKAPVLPFPEACRAPGSSCLEVVYRVAERNVACRWTVLSNPPEQVQGKSVVRLRVLNEDAAAAKYTMMIKFQNGMATRPIKHEQPEYPMTAKASHISGTVKIRIVVAPDGTVAGVTSVDGPEQLKASAADAVTRWVYAPVALGDHAVAWQTDVTVNFNFGSRFGDAVQPGK